MIFEDVSGKRWRFVVAAFWLVTLSVAFAMSVLVLSASVSPRSHSGSPHATHGYPNPFLRVRKAIAAHFSDTEESHVEISHANVGTELYKVRKTEGKTHAYSIEQVGKTIEHKKLVLTFDDGPDPQWTPQILDILEQHNVPAVFFVTGKYAYKYPELLKDIDAKGHTVGNHTYSHPNIFEVSSLRLRSELNMTERAIESATGKRTTLFRAPYFIDTKFTDRSKLAALSSVSDLGYSIMGANIDSRDWEQEAPEDIISSISAEIKNPNSHVILMHDAGGNRSVTVAALETLIPELQSQGYEFVTPSSAIGATPEVFMQQATAWESRLAKLSAIATATARILWSIIKWLFFITTGIATLRIVFIGSLVVLSLFRKEKWRENPAISPHTLVSVIIPAFNEEQTIVRTVEALLLSDHAALEILVVDDGSTDKTAHEVEKLQKHDTRIHLIRKDNGGKSTALNRGFIEAQADIVVTIDADTIVKPHTITELIQPFSDPSITAASGNVEVGNVRNIVTGFQALEYITTQNFDRRAFDVLNCITVVPGATSAWRRLDVIHAGGFTPDTLAEDADLTMTLLREGARIIYVPEAVSQTEAPLQIRCLTKQRFRWVYGTMQCLRKHAGALGRGTLGIFALPNILLFHILFPLLAPIGDVVLVVSLFQQEIPDMMMWYALFIYIDLFGSMLAFTLEQKPRKIMWLILLQRFCYRQFMYIILFKSIIAALRGKKHNWNRVERTGTVVHSPSVA